MAERIERLVALRRLDSQTKASQVLVALDAIVASGHAVNIAALARTAGVSRRFIYDHPELRAEAERRASEVADRHAGALAASARVTAASLRADLENAKATNHRLEADLTLLRRRLGLVLGQEVLADTAGHGIQDTRSAARLDEVEQALFQARETLAQRTEELDAARQINRELISRLNRDQR